MILVEPLVHLFMFLEMRARGPELRHFTGEDGEYVCFLETPQS